MKILIPGIMAVVFNTARSEVLLHLRSDNHLWSVPGGSAEYGESASEVVLREVMEETGYTIQIVRAFALYTSPETFLFHYPDGNTVHSYVVGVECVAIDKVTTTLSDDSLEIRWFPIGSLPENLMSMQREVIADAVANQVFQLK